MSGGGCVTLVWGGGVALLLVGVWWCVCSVCVCSVCVCLVWCGGAVRCASRCACVCLSCVFVWGVSVFVHGLFGDG